MLKGRFVLGQVIAVCVSRRQISGSQLKPRGTLLMRGSRPSSGYLTPQTLTGWFHGLPRVCTSTLHIHPAFYLFLAAGDS